MDGGRTKVGGENYSSLIATLRNNYNSGITRPLMFRKQQLKQLLKMLEVHERDYVQALKMDLSKSRMEGVCMEVEFCRNSIRGAIADMESWALDEHVEKNLVTLLDSTFIRREPKPTTKKPQPPPCPPPSTLPPPCPQLRSTTASPCSQATTTASPCQPQVTDHPDIAEWKRTRFRTSRPSYQALQSYQNDQNQPASSDLERNRQAWISASSSQQSHNIQSDQPIVGSSEGWWRVSNQPKAHGAKNSTANKIIFRPSRVYVPSRIHDEDNAGVPKIPEIDVRKSGVILSVISDASKQPVPRTTAKLVTSSSNQRAQIPSILKNKERGMLHLYQYFQKKAVERKTRHNLINF